MGSPGQFVNANYVNASTNCDILFDTAAKLYGINRETVIIQLKSEISANYTEHLAWPQVQLKGTMKSLDAMGILICNLHQACAVVLILRDGDEADRAKTLEKLNNLDTIRSKKKTLISLINFFIYILGNLSFDQVLQLLSSSFCISVLQ